MLFIWAVRCWHQERRGKMNYRRIWDALYGAAPGVSTARSLYKGIALANMFDRTVPSMDWLAEEAW